jgi:hypothetical protein
MNGTYVIYWKSKINGRTGRGTRLLNLEEAEALATELNLEYPSIDHEAVKADSVVSVMSPSNELLSAA